MNTENPIADEYIDMFADEIVKCNYNHSITSYKEVQVPVIRRFHSDLRTKIANISGQQHDETDIYDGYILIIFW